MAHPNTQSMLKSHLLYKKGPEIFRFRAFIVVREAGLEVHVFHFMYSNPSILAK